MSFGLICTNTDQHFFSGGFSSDHFSFFMDTQDNTTSLCQRMAQHLHAHRILFYWSVPVCFVVVLVIMFCVPKTYQSSWSLVVEDQRAIDGDRTLTINSSEQYDLGLFQTRNSINEYSYSDLVTSSQLLKSLCAAPVSTLDGQFEGTYSDYINRYMRKPLFQRLKGSIIRLFRRKVTCAPVSSATNDEVYLTQGQAATMAIMRQQITCTFDKRTDIVKIDVVTQDPLVSAQVAKHVENQLEALIMGYQTQKIESILSHIDTLTLNAENEWKEAVHTRSNNADTYKQIYESFHRQQVIYQAQMVVRKPFVTLSEPTIVYEKVGPHPFQTSILATLVFAILLAAWFCRRELMEIL